MAGGTVEAVAIADGDIADNLQTMTNSVGLVMGATVIAGTIGPEPRRPSRSGVVVDTSLHSTVSCSLTSSTQQAITVSCTVRLYVYTPRSQVQPKLHLDGV